MDFIRFYCVGCGKKLKAKAAIVGREGRCPRCGTKITIPPASVATEPIEEGPPPSFSAASASPGTRSTSSGGNHREGPRDRAAFTSLKRTISNFRRTWVPVLGVLFLVGVWILPRVLAPGIEKGIEDLQRKGVLSKPSDAASDPIFQRYYRRGAELAERLMMSSIDQQTGDQFEKFFEDVFERPDVDVALDALLDRLLADERLLDDMNGIFEALSDDPAFMNVVLKIAAGATSEEEIQKKVEKYVEQIVQAPAFSSAFEAAFGSAVESAFESPLVKSQLMALLRTPECRKINDELVRGLMSSPAGRRLERMKPLKDQKAEDELFAVWFDRASAHPAVSAELNGYMDSLVSDAAFKQQLTRAVVDAAKDEEVYKLTLAFCEKVCARQEVTAGIQRFYKAIFINPRRTSAAVKEIRIILQDPYVDAELQKYCAAVLDHLAKQQSFRQAVLRGAFGPEQRKHLTGFANAVIECVPDH